MQGPKMLQTRNCNRFYITTIEPWHLNNKLFNVVLTCSYLVIAVRGQTDVQLQTLFPQYASKNKFCKGQKSNIYLDMALLAVINNQTLSGESLQP